MKKKKKTRGRRRRIWFYKRIKTFFNKIVFQMFNKIVICILIKKKIRKEATQRNELIRKILMVNFY
jgi:hypothetical protein